jgi:hypothetical protein
VLESNSFVISRPHTRRSTPRKLDIHDGETGEFLGTATTQLGWFGFAVGLIFGKKGIPAVTEVRERLDDSLVFTLHRSGLLARRMEILDAQGERLGSYHPKSLRLTGGIAISDALGNPFGEVRGKWLKTDLLIVTPDGKAELGRVTQYQSGLFKELFARPRAYCVWVNPDFTEQPIAKMLILGAALAADDLLDR